MEVLWRLAYLLALLGVGVLGRQVGPLNERRTELLTSFAFWVALPALLFSSTYDQPLGELVSPALLVGVWIVIFATMGVAWLLHRRQPSQARQSVAVVQSYHSNLGFLGLPLVAATFGDATTAIAGVVLGVGVLTQVPLTIVLLISLTDADASIRQELRGVLTNPVLGGLAVGLVASVVGFQVPAVVDAGLGAISELALPIALLAVGASLRIDSGSFEADETGAVVAMKVLGMPVIAWLVFSALGVGPAAFAAAVVMLGTPSGVSTFVYASELGGDPGFASVNVFATTTVSVATLFLFITLVQ